MYCILLYFFSFFSFFFFFHFIFYLVNFRFSTAIYLRHLSFIHCQSIIAITTVPIILGHDNNSVLLEFLCKCVKIVPPGYPACHTTYFFPRDKMLFQPGTTAPMFFLLSWWLLLFQPYHSTYVLIVLMVPVIPALPQHLCSSYCLGGSCYSSLTTAPMFLLS